ncbi:homoserine O-succinyltransferase [Agaribacter marinus]|uniref:Homoserine O-succinyltransferase n=1 Tax=Agaribacter marinus TaxID=1431249 RepID=A0AA37SZ89_9ALTE|nr:homoserine O-succinyltransferase [Agaribacter marinus]GLR70691.1 homoserine O-succinyltransferase [Agaribacter marinus]
MPIKVPSELPALDGLLNENIFAMDNERALSQNIRPMNVGILNLMPNKIETELQILRLLSNTPLQIDIDLIRIDDSAPKNTPIAHMNAFYHTFNDIREKKYDGLIVTGAPLGNLEYEDVKYWDKMIDLMDWAKRNVQSTIYLCWAANAALYHFFGLQRKVRAEKLSGVFEHKVMDEKDSLMRGFDPMFWAPHSRVGDIPVSDYEQAEGIKILGLSSQAGVYLSATHDKRMIFITGHPEYDSQTLAGEYSRDIGQGLAPKVPVNYFQDDNPACDILVRWKSHGNLLFTNWLNYCVYQITPFDLNELAE